VSERLVDVVIAVHEEARPIERAVASVMTSAPPGTRAIVVCHGIPTDAIARRLEGVRPGEVLVLAHADGVASPAGPFNAGLDAAQARFVSVLGSDDFLEAGALRHWSAQAERTGAAAVMARVRHQKGGLVRTPPTRWGRRSANLSLTADRLAYRTAPLGLLRRKVLEENGLRFTPRLSTGEDLDLGLRLWSGTGVAYARTAPAYVVGSDAAVRVTMSARPVLVDLDCCLRVVAAPWFTRLTGGERDAVVVKLLRIHVFAAVLNRPDVTTWVPRERQGLADAAERILAAAPSPRRYLSLVERRLLDAAMHPTGETGELLRFSARRVRHGRWDTLLTPDPRGFLSAQGPLRLMAASALMR
jgi:Glycosyltransferase like family 2